MARAGLMTAPLGRPFLRRVPGWRSFQRSLSARILVFTIVLAAVAAVVTAWFLLHQVRDGLLDTRVDAVSADMAEEVADARTRLTAASGVDLDAASQRRELIEPITQRGANRGYYAALTGPVGDAGLGGSEYSTGLDLRSIPSALADHFESPEAATAWSSTTVLTDADPRGTPGVAIGAQLVLPADGNTYTLYLIYPLSAEEQTLALLSQVMLVAFALLLLMLAVAAWLVARRVVTPIRSAREVAERLSAGELAQRMKVRGEDDLARLAVSFNQMATVLQRQIRELEELSRVQRRFTSDVSHELRTPLTTVRMAADMIHDAREGFDEPTARASELLVAELDRFEELLVELLEISRFDAGAARLEVEDFDLAAMARRLAASNQPLADHRGIALRVVAPGQPVLAEVDPRRVERIVRNLIANAVDHAVDADTVVIEVAGDDHSAAVSVRDHGVGLTPEQAELVFDRFWRADPARTRTTGGTGLGLALAMEDAKLHGGWLQVWGEPGKGAQFTLTVPRHSGHLLREGPLPRVPEDAEAVS